MASKSQRATQGTFSLTAHQADAKTLLAFNLERSDATKLAGFTIQCQPDGQAAYFLHNLLRFKTPADHVQVASEPAQSTVNAPIHKFRWLHVPGTVHQGLKPFFGPYTYTVTPRYFDAHRRMQALDPALSASVNIDVVPFAKAGLQLGFTRGYVQSQGFVNHFGLTAPIQPSGSELLFDTSAQAGVHDGHAFTFLDEYEWLGFMARQRIFDLLGAVLTAPTLTLDVFAYDLNEPDILKPLLELAEQGRIRVILDNSTLHHNAANPKSEDQFEALFRQRMSGAADIRRGKFSRYAHDKVLLVRDAGAALRVLTGSTNFSVNGLYVNSNHVLVFDDQQVAGKYGEVFDEAWKDAASGVAFRKTPLANNTFSFTSNTPTTDITFAPHPQQFADSVLEAIADRIASEDQAPVGTGSVLFAVMQLDATSGGPVVPALQALHTNQNIFSFGISDSPQGIFLYTPGSNEGVLVTGKPTRTRLPPPFSQVPNLDFIHHQIHHKFVVCDFNGEDPVVFCGSSNLASGGEHDNGDNLLTIRDGDVATAFAVEAVALVDHFNFLDRLQEKSTAQPAAVAAARAVVPASKVAAAVSAGWFLGNTDAWTKPYFNPNDLHFKDRNLFA